jgi:hypothetical protein
LRHETNPWTMLVSSIAVFEGAVWVF